MRLVERLVKFHLPGHPVSPVARLGGGADHDAYLVADRLVVRLGKGPRDDGGAQRAEREMRLLRAVQRVSPLPVPVPVFAAPEVGCTAYHYLPGTPLLHLPRSRRAALAQGVAVALGGFMAAVHSLPLGPLGTTVDQEDRAPSEWLGEAARNHAGAAHAIPPVYRPRMAAFLAAPIPAAAFADVPLRFTHNDLGIEHVLMDPPGRVSGVIDWSDAAVADPAVDFARLERDLGTAAAGAALQRYAQTGGAGLDATALRRMGERASFYARCLLLEDLAYGLETGEGVYVEKSLDALPGLFPRCA